MNEKEETPNNIEGPELKPEAFEVPESSETESIPERENTEAEESKKDEELKKVRAQLATEKFPKKLEIKEQKEKKTLWDGRNPVVVVNPIANHGLKKGDRLVKFMKKEGFDPVVIQTERPGHATEIVRELMKGPNAIFVVGGDGTMSEMVRGVVAAEEKNEKAAIVSVPGGSANDTSSILIHGGIREIKKMIQGNKQPEIKRIDALKMTLDDSDRTREIAALGYIGFGFTAKGAEIVREKRPSNRVSEALFVPPSVFSKPTEINYEGKDQKFRHFLISNAGVCGRVVKTRDCKIDDGLMDITKSEKGIFSLLGKLVKGWPRGMEGEKRKDISFNIPKGAIAQVDGDVVDIAPNTNVSVRVLEGAVPMVTG